MPRLTWLPALMRSISTVCDRWRIAIDCSGRAALIIAALFAAFGFSRRDRVRRDYLLGWTGIASMAAILVSLAAGVLRSAAYADQNGLDTLAAGLYLGTAGLLAAAVAGAIAAFAFFEAAQPGGLTAAAGAFALFAVIGFASEVIVAIAKSGLGYSEAEAASTWFAALAALASCAAAVCVMAALHPAFARALQRLRSAGLSGAPGGQATHR